MLCNDDSYYCRRAGGGRRNRCEDLASYVCRVKVLSYYFSSGSFFGGHVLSYIKPRTGPKCLMKISQCGSGGNREFWQWLFQENPAASLMKRESQLTCITNYVISRAVQYLEKWSKRPRFHISPRSFADPPYQTGKRFFSFSQSTYKWIYQPRQLQSMPRWEETIPSERM